MLHKQLQHNFDDRRNDMSRMMELIDRNWILLELKNGEGNVVDGN